MESWTSPPDIAGECETFRGVEHGLQRSVELNLLDSPTQELVDFAAARQASFWSEHDASIQAHWALIALAGRLTLEAARVERESRAAGSDPKAYLQAYAEGGTPWCVLDTHYRHLERHWHRFDVNQALHAGLERLIVAARARYTTVCGDLAERFLHAYSAASLTAPGASRQTDVFGAYVGNGLREAQTAYVMVDALRFEMARELAQSLGDDFDCELHWATGAVPGITEIGMGALVLPPDASPEIVEAGDGKLGLKTGDIVLKTRDGRIKYLKSHAGVEMCDTKLEQLLPSPAKGLREAIAAAGLTVVTSQEIDQLCEGDNVHMARRFVDELLSEVAGAVHVLAPSFWGRIVVTADHGYLFGRKPRREEELTRPRRQEGCVHRRVGSAALAAQRTSPTCARDWTRPALPVTSTSQYRGPLRASRFRAARAPTSTVGFRCRNT